MAQATRRINDPAAFKSERELKTALRVLPSPVPAMPDRREPDHREHLPPSVEPVRSVGRVVSVDVLRGFAIFWILGGDALAWSIGEMSDGKSGYLSAIGHFFAQQLTHEVWDGLRFYDFVFPLFVFTVGLSIVLALPRLVECEGKAKAHARVMRRFVLLFLLGVIYYGGASNQWPDVRLLGVLQRLALCYLVASLLFLNVSLRGMIVAFVALLAGYWALMTFVPVPGVGAGSYAQGANLANWIDFNYLPGKKWEDAWDPEGLLSTLPAIGSCLIGVFAGMLLASPSVTPQRKSLWLIGAGIAVVLAGHLWGLQFPLIKSIWTSSFVLVTGGYSLILLGVFHQIIDVWGAKAWTTVFVWFGANAILLYFLNEIASFELAARRLVGGDVAALLDAALTPGAGRLAVSAVGLAIAIALAGFFYRRKIFLRV
jgi:predicted acyltransferase